LEQKAAGAESDLFLKSLKHFRFQMIFLSGWSRKQRRRKVVDADTILRYAKQLNFKMYILIACSCIIQY